MVRLRVNLCTLASSCFFGLAAFAFYVNHAGRDEFRKLLVVTPFAEIHSNCQTTIAQHCYLLLLPPESGLSIICPPAAFLEYGSRFS